jgi:hypothetical protein
MAGGGGAGEHGYTGVSQQGGRLSAGGAHTVIIAIAAVTGLDLGVVRHR